MIFTISSIKTILLLSFGYLKMDFKFLIVNHGRFMWTILWQFAQSITISCALVLWSGDISDTGMIWCPSMKFLPSLLYISSKSNWQTWQNNLLWIFIKFSLAIFTARLFLSLDLCIRSTIFPSGNSPSVSMFSSKSFSRLKLQNFLAAPNAPDFDGTNPIFLIVVEILLL